MRQTEAGTAACNQFEQELQDYMEGEYRPFVPAHARECRFCSVVLEDLEALRAAARGLPLNEPSPALWSSIRAQLTGAPLFTEKAGFWNWLGQQAFLRRPIPVAVFACLFVLGCLVTVPRNYSERDAGWAVAGLPARTTLRSVAFMGDSGALEHAVQELQETFRAREGSLAPDLKATYEQSLTSLDASIRECSDSLQREPDNSLAHEYLLSAYSQKAEVLSSALEFDEGH